LCLFLAVLWCGDFFIVVVRDFCIMIFGIFFLFLLIFGLWCLMGWCGVFCGGLIALTWAWFGMVGRFGVVFGCAFGCFYFYCERSLFDLCLGGGFGSLLFLGFGLLFVPSWFQGV